jgi:predicted ribosomally synthesized peptide with SipW-like signal peptide
MKFKTIAMTGMMSLAGLGLVGAGAHAVFTATTTSSQQVTAGNLSLTLSSPLATGDGSVGNPLVLPAIGPTQSSFVANNQVTITNTGNITATEISLAVGATNNGSAASIALQGEMWACLSSSGTILFNEPLNTAIGYGTIAIGATTVPPPDNYTLTLYAGSADAGCGLTFTAVSGGAFQSSPTQSIVAGATNTDPTALSLDNFAENGVVTPTMSMTFTG